MKFRPDDRAGHAIGGETHGDRGQSEVIGVVLMVALLTVLAALLGQFVFGLDVVSGDDEVVAPQVTLETTVEADGDLTIGHRSGSAARTASLTVVGSESGEFDVDWTDQGVGEEWDSGEAISIDPVDGEEVRIVWNSPNTDDSAFLLRYEFEA